MCLLLTVALLYLGSGVMLILLALPFVLAFAIAFCGYAAGGAVAVVGLAAGLIFHPTLPFVAAAVFLPPAIAAAYVIRSKKRMRIGVMISVAAALAGLALGIFILTQMTGEGIVDYIVGYLGDALRVMPDAQIKMTYELSRAADVLSGAVTSEALAAATAAEAVAWLQSMMHDFLQLFLVVIIAVYSMLLGFLSFVIGRAACKKRGMDVVKIPPVSEYTLPRRLWLAAVVLVVFAYIGADAGWQAFDILAITLYYIFMVIFIGQAVVLLDYLMKQRNMGKGVRVLLHVIAVILVGTLILPYVGLAENALGIRRRISARKAGNA